MKYADIESIRTAQQSLLLDYGKKELKYCSKFESHIISKLYAKVRHNYQSK